MKEALYIVERPIKYCMNREVKVYLPVRIIDKLNEIARTGNETRSDVMRRIIMKEIDGEVMSNGNNETETNND